jgi:hypothetical protein
MMGMSNAPEILLVRANEKKNKNGRRLQWNREGEKQAKLLMKNGRQARQASC